MLGIQTLHSILNQIQGINEVASCLSLLIGARDKRRKLIFSQVFVRWQLGHIQERLFLVNVGEEANKFRVGIFTLHNPGDHYFFARDHF